MEQPEFSDVVDLIRKDDPRYDRRAYFFLREALDYTVKAVRKAEKKAGKRRGTSHVSGQELLEGIRDFALKQFGPMTLFLFTEWGIRKCRDFGEMVYQLIEYGVFSKTDADQKEDFCELFTFREAFAKPFEPANRRPRRRVLNKTAEGN